MRLGFLIFGVFFSLALLAQTHSIQKSAPLTKAKPEEVGISSERLERIDKMLTGAIEEEIIPGAVALIARKGKIVYHKAFGMADVENKREFKTDDIFRIASMTKAVTATAVMMLWEEGKFGLDDPISKYIPEFKDPQLIKSFNERDSSFTGKPAKREITIRHLITHTSGIGYGFIDSDIRFKMMYKKAGIIDGFTSEKVILADNIKKLAKMPLHHNPGEDFTYSEGLDVLGYFIEVVSGETFDEYLKKHIFDPLGMKNTAFHLNSAQAKKLVPVQTKKDGKWGRYASSEYDVDYPIKGAKTYFAGGAGLCSTVEDYATFLQMYLNNGELNGYRLLSSTTVKMIMCNQIGDLWEGESDMFSGKHYGLVFGVVGDKGVAKGGIGSKGTFEWGGYFHTKYYADPEEQFIGLIFRQVRDVNTKKVEARFQQMASASIDD